MIDLRPFCAGYYKMNDNANNRVVVDSMGISNGIASRNTNLMHSAEFGGSLAFSDAICDYVDLGRTFEEVFRKDFSINIWVKFFSGKVDDNDFFGSETQGEAGAIEAIIGYKRNTAFGYSTGTQGAMVDVPRSFVYDTWQMLTVKVEQKLGMYFTFPYSYFQISFYKNKVLLGYSLWPDAEGEVIPESGNMDNFRTNLNCFLGAINNPNFSTEYGVTSTFTLGLISKLALITKAISDEEMDFLYGPNGEGTEELYEQEIIAEEIGVIEKALFTRITTDTTIATLISTRFFPNQIPQGQLLPAAIYQQGKGEREHTMAGPAGLVNAEYTITCYAVSYSQVKTLSETIRKRLDGYKGTVGDVVIGGIFLVDEVDVPSFKAGTDVLNRFGKSLTFVVWFKE